MSRANSITIGQEVFPSKKALTDKVRSILYAYDRRSILNAEHREFIIDLLQRHPNATGKIGVGVKSIYVDRNDHGNSGFYIERIDNTRTDFSFLKCINAKTPRHDVVAAFREEIKEQIFEARDAIFSGNPVRCPISGEVLTKHGCHIDHVVPFESIMCDFIASENLDPDKIETGGHGDMEESRTLADAALRQRWQQYHRRRAQLRAVAKKENLSRKGL